MLHRPFQIRGQLPIEQLLLRFSGIPIPLQPQNWGRAAFKNTQSEIRHSADVPGWTLGTDSCGRLYETIGKICLEDVSRAVSVYPYCMSDSRSGWVGGCEVTHVLLGGRKAARWSCWDTELQEVNFSLTTGETQFCFIFQCFSLAFREPEEKRAICLGTASINRAQLHWIAWEEFSDTKKNQNHHNNKWIKSNNDFMNIVTH